MQPTIDGLKTFISTHRLDTKVLIAPSLTQGHSIAEAAAKGQPWFNLHVHTVSSLAEAILGSSLEICEAATPDIALFMVDQVLQEQLADCRYFNQILPSLGFSRAFVRAFADFRSTGLESINQAAFVNPDKGADFRRLLDAYRSQLSAEGLVDGTDILQRATEHVSLGMPHGWQGAHLLVCAHTEISDLEQKFLQALAAERLHVLPHTFSLADLPERNRWACKLYNKRPVARFESPVGIHRSAGFENEVASLFDWLVKAKARADEVEILYTNPQRYLPLLRQATQKFGIECTFGEGIPIGQTRPGRAGLGLLTWIRDGFHEPRLRALIVSNLIRVTDRKKMSAGQFARVLRQARIGWGRERYCSALRALASASRLRADRAESELDQEIEEPEVYRVSCLRRAEEAEYVEEQMTKLLERVPDVPDKIAAPNLAGQFLPLFEALLPETLPEEREGRTAVLESLRRMAAFKGIALPRHQALEQLHEILGGLSIQSSGPKPGCLHLSSVAGGGMSGRRFLWILGLDETSFPRTGLQDPILLDTERAMLSDTITTRLQLPNEDKVLLKGIVAGHHGETAVSYSVAGLDENQVLSPSAAVLDFYRGKNPEKAGATFSEMSRELPAASDFVLGGSVAAAASYLLSEHQAWLKLADECERNAHHSILFSFPHLLSGIEAARARYGTEPTGYDGWLRAPGEDLDFTKTHRPLSASSLDILAQCPFKFFLRYILGIKPPDDLEFDSLDWLSPLERGRLIHRILHDAIELLRPENRPLQYPQDLAALHELASKLIHRQRDEVPPPNEIAYEMEKDAMLQTVEVFLREEAARGLNPADCQAEIPFGMEGGEGKRNASQTPVPLMLPDGKPLHIHGQIDRLDEIEKGVFEVWDYKTGSPRPYESATAFQSGRRLQHIIYGMVVESMIENARVSKAGYFFTGVKGRGERVSHLREEWPELGPILERMMNVVRQGEFIHRTQKDECKLCDYRMVCINVNQACSKAKRMLQSPDQILGARKELERI
ncbi:MAG: PD-(D/E)XK nuclease family protein [Planctomycetota bacterium]|nr:PD-(D/E)XK nuclease family protein [Planctomycetota bacterium]